MYNRKKSANHLYVFTREHCIFQGALSNTVFCIKQSAQALKYKTVQLERNESS